MKVIKLNAKIRELFDEAACLETALSGQLKTLGRLKMRAWQEIKAAYPEQNLKDAQVNTEEGTMSVGTPNKEENNETP